MFQIKGVEKIKTHNLCSIIPPIENPAVHEVDNVEKHKASQETDDNIK
jgi:hypothetical protein